MMRLFKRTEKSIKDYVEEFTDVTRSAATACLPWIGRGKETEADGAAVEAMRRAMNRVRVSGKIVIGEGERDKAPMLYIGEKVGAGGLALDIAVDPLEGTSLCANYMPGAMSVMAVGPEGSLLQAPDIYMEKLVVGPKVAPTIIGFELTPASNVRNMARVLQKPVEEITVCVLRRERHKMLIADIRKAGARVKLIEDGDIMASIATCIESSGIDAYYGIGGAPEGVIAAAALKCLGGHMFTRFVFKDREEKQRAVDMGVHDGVYEIKDMIQDEAMFFATMVTGNEFAPKLHTMRATTWSGFEILPSPTLDDES